VCKELCDDDGVQSCPDCGKLICFDTKFGDDIMRPAFVTSSGDLYCDRCGKEHERAEEEEHDDFEDYDFDDLP
jgi:hypothetical protein